MARHLHNPGHAMALQPGYCDGPALTCGGAPADPKQKQAAGERLSLNFSTRVADA